MPAALAGAFDVACTDPPYTVAGAGGQGGDRAGQEQLGAGPGKPCGPSG